MPQFAPGETHVATLPETIQPAGVNFKSEVWLGPDSATKVASSGPLPLVSSGSLQNISHPIVVPATPGNYHVYKDLSIAGILVSRQVDVDVSIVSVPRGTILSAGWVRIDFGMFPKVVWQNTGSVPFSGRIYISADVWTQFHDSDGQPTDTGWVTHNLIPIVVAANPGQVVTLGGVAVDYMPGSTPGFREAGSYDIFVCYVGNSGHLSVKLYDNATNALLATLEV